MPIFLLQSLLKIIQIESGLQLEALMNLNDFLNNALSEVDLTAAAYLLSAVVNSLGNQIVDQAFSEVRSLTSIIKHVINFL